jgi:hypothetical protein
MYIHTAFKRTISGKVETSLVLLVCVRSWAGRYSSRNCDLLQADVRAGVDLTITIFCDFRQFSATKLASF